MKPCTLLSWMSTLTLFSLGHTTSPLRRAIVNGRDADAARYPYFVRLDYEGEFGCGGSLVHPDMILTAAHCALPEDLGILSVVFLDPVSGNATGDGILRKTVLEIIAHHSYDDWTEAHDVALLRIDPVPDEFPILSWNRDRSLLQSGDPLTVIGVGATHPNGNPDSDADVLQEVEVSVVDDASCDPLYDDTLHRKAMLCAVGTEGRDSCSGDSGGPLLQLGADPTQDIHVGVVSFGGERCGDVSQPGVYASTAYVSDWIETVICQESVVPPSDCRVLVDPTVGALVWTANETCRDLPGAFYVDWWFQFQRCNWLRSKARAEFYCEPSHESWLQCPFTCHACTYEVDADQDTASGEDFDVESSSPVAVVFCFLLSCLICVQCGAWGFLEYRRRKRARDAATPPLEPPKDSATLVLPAAPPLEVHPSSS